MRTQFSRVQEKRNAISSIPFLFLYGTKFVSIEYSPSHRHSHSLVPDPLHIFNKSNYTIGALQLAYIVYLLISFFIP